ncbi:MAG: hypothetical protein LBB91_00835 [Clostridiales bacterium]|nr:hypothetical protein [Clostridiales bacterium]
MKKSIRSKPFSLILILTVIIAIVPVMSLSATIDNNSRLPAPIEAPDPDAVPAGAAQDLADSIDSADPEAEIFDAIPAGTAQDLAEGIDLVDPEKEIIEEEIMIENQLNTVSISGRIRSYNPNKPTTVLLKKGAEIACEIAIANEGGYGQVDQGFTLNGVAPGIYDLVITKAAHTKFTVQNIVVGDESLDLTNCSQPELQLITLRCGDISGDGLINDADLTVLWRSGNYNKKAGEADNDLCDLNGDGLINDADLTILWLAYNYNRGAITIQWEPPAPFQRAIALLDKNGPIAIPFAVQGDVDGTVAFLTDFITGLVSTITDIGPIEVMYWAESDGGDGCFYLMDPGGVAGNNYKISLTTTTGTVLPAEIAISTVAGKQYNVPLSASGITDFEGMEITLKYDDAVFDLVDLCASFKEKVLTTGPVGATGITITQIDPGEIYFTVDKSIPPGKTWKGVINVVRFEAKTTGQSIIKVE